MTTRISSLKTPCTIESIKQSSPIPCINNYTYTRRVVERIDKKGFDVFKDTLPPNSFFPKINKGRKGCRSNSIISIINMAEWSAMFMVVNQNLLCIPDRVLKYTNIQCLFIHSQKQDIFIVYIRQS